METKKVGFLENSLGERSGVKMMNVIAFSVFMVTWGGLCFIKGDFIEIPPVILGLLGLPGLQNTINKWIEATNGKDAKVIAELLEKVRK